MYETEKKEIEMCRSYLFADATFMRGILADLPHFLQPSSGTWFLGSTCFSDSDYEMDYTTNI